MSDWISVDDRLPEVSHPVLGLVVTDENYLDHHVIFYEGDMDDGRPYWEICTLVGHPYYDVHTRGYCDTSIDPENVTHWMPLPPHPQNKYIKEQK